MKTSGTDHSPSAAPRRGFFPERQLWPALAVLIAIGLGVAGWAGSSWMGERQRETGARENAILIQRASSALNSRGVAHVLPPSLVKVDRTIRLLREALRGVPNDSSLAQIEDLTEEQLADAAKFLSVRSQNDQLTLIYTHDAPPGALTPVSDAAGKRKR